MNNKKFFWNKPTIDSLENKEVKNTIEVAACSRFSGCWPGAAHLDMDSIPGKPPVELM